MDSEQEKGFGQEKPDQKLDFGPLKAELDKLVEQFKAEAEVTLKVAREHLNEAGQQLRRAFESAGAELRAAAERSRGGSGE